MDTKSVKPMSFYVWPLVIYAVFTLIASSMAWSLGEAAAGVVWLGFLGEVLILPWIPAKDDYKEAIYLVLAFAALSHVGLTLYGLHLMSPDWFGLPGGGDLVSNINPFLIGFVLYLHSAFGLGLETWQVQEKTKNTPDEAED